MDTISQDCPGRLTSTCHSSSGVEHPIRNRAVVSSILTCGSDYPSMFRRLRRAVVRSAKAQKHCPRASDTLPRPAYVRLSLASGSADFYSNLLESELSSRGEGEGRVALATAAARAASILSERGTGRALSAAQIAALAETWSDFIAALASRSPALARRLGGSSAAENSGPGHLSRSEIRH